MLQRARKRGCVAGSLEGELCTLAARVKRAGRAAMPLLARAKLGSKDRQCQAALPGKRLVFGVALQGRRVKSIFTRLQMKSLLAAAAREAGAAAPLPHQPASPPPAWPHAPSKSASGKDRRDASLFPPRAITTSPSKLPPPLSGEPRQRLEAGPVIVRPLDSGVALAPKDDLGLGAGAGAAASALWQATASLAAASFHTGATLQIVTEAHE
jgi:hypothetical protein